MNKNQKLGLGVGLTVLAAGLTAVAIHSTEAAAAPPPPPSGGTVTLLVSVVGYATMKGIPGATIELEGATSLKETTGPDGFYEFDNLPVGTYTATVSASGYISQKLGPITLKVGTSPSWTFELS